METLPSEIKLFVSKLSSEHRWQVLALPAPPPTVAIPGQMELPWVAEQPPGATCPQAEKQR